MTSSAVMRPMDLLGCASLQKLCQTLGSMKKDAMGEAAVVFATAEWCGSDISCVVFPPGHRCNSLRKHVPTILASGMLLIRQYDPDKLSADEAMGEMQDCSDLSTSILRMPRPADAADAEPSEPETVEARRERLRAAESVVIRTLNDELILVCPKGIDDLLPLDFQQAFRECSALWISQYQRGESTVRQSLLALKADRPEAFTVFDLPGRQSRRKGRGSRARTSGP